MTSSIYKIQDNIHNHGTVTSVDPVIQGSGYTNATVAISGDGTGATADAHVEGTINSIAVTDNGSNNYGIDDTVIVNRGTGSGTDVDTTLNVFGFVKQGNIKIDNGGTGYNSTTTLEATASNLGGRRLKLIVTAVENGVITSVNVTESGTGYSSNPTITVTGTGTGAVITTQNIRGNVNSIDVNNPGINSGYRSDQVSVDFNTQTGNGAIAEVSEIEGGVYSYTVTNPGQNYTGATAVVSGDSSGATATVTVSEVDANNNILSEDISITKDMVSPGGGGILRLYFSMVFDTSPATISVFNNDDLKGNLNADNTAEVIDNGYYRFDIDVEQGDSINLKANQGITFIHFIRSHLVQFGA